MGVKERLIEFMSVKDYSQGRFEKYVGLSNGLINNIGDSIRKKSLEKIVAKFPDLNTAWLLTGEGSMLKMRQEVTPEQADSLTLDRNTEILAYQKIILSTLALIHAPAAGLTPDKLEDELLKKVDEEKVKIAEQMRQEVS